MEQLKTLITESQNKKHIIVSSICLVLGIIIGFSINILNHNTYKDGWAGANSRLSSSKSVGILSNRGEVRMISGVVESINGNKINIKIEPLELLADPSLDIRTTIVDSNTSMAINIPRDPKIVQKEMDLFIKNMQSSKDRQDLTPPKSSTEEKATISDIKIGSTILVTASSDIKNIKEFNAIDIKAY